MGPRGFQAQNLTAGSVAGMTPHGITPYAIQIHIRGNEVEVGF
jgi:hypothetical protein